MLYRKNYAETKLGVQNDMKQVLPSPLQEFLLLVVKLRGIPLRNKDNNLISFRSTESKRISATENLIPYYRI